MKPKLSFSTVKRLYIDHDPADSKEIKKNLIRRFLNSPNALAYYIKDLVHDINLDPHDELIKQDDDRNSVVELTAYLHWLQCKGKRTGIDWSKHELAIDEYRSGKFGFLIHTLKVPDTRCRMVVFTNIFSEFDDQLLVTGDYSDWIFCRAFVPSPDGSVSDGYWREKLRIANHRIQEQEFDSEATKKELQEEINRVTSEENFYYGEQNKSDYLEYLERCIQYADYSEGEYVSKAYYEMPGFLDSESVIFYKKTDIQLQVVFDAFEEICRRLKEQEEVKNG